MTSKEIEWVISGLDAQIAASTAWEFCSALRDRSALLEIAYQLAVMNERAVPIDFVPGGTRPMDDFQKGQNR